MERVSEECLLVLGSGLDLLNLRLFRAQFVHFFNFTEEDLLFRGTPRSRPLLSAITLFGRFTLDRLFLFNYFSFFASPNGATYTFTWEG